MSRKDFTQLVIAKINQVNIHHIKDDNVRFIPDEKPLEVWSYTYFEDLAVRIRFVDE